MYISELGKIFVIRIKNDLIAFVRNRIILNVYTKNERYRKRYYYIVKFIFM